MSMSFNFCHDVIVPSRKEEYQVCATFLTAMTKDFAMTAVLPPYDEGRCLPKVVEKGSPEVGANVGDLFSNAMS
jgi:hypothetical protein